VAFPAVTTSSMRLTILATDLRQSVDPVKGTRRVLPFGVSEVRVEGADDLRKPLDLQASTGLACGFGPDLSVDGQARSTRVEGTVRDLLERRPMRVTMCSASPSLTLPNGTHRVRLLQTAAVQPWRLTLTARSAVPAVKQPVHVVRWEGTHRTLLVPAAGRDTVVALAENANAGWKASLGAHRLRSVRLDGWRQGYVVPAGMGGTLVLTYAPDGPYRTGLLIGLILALLVVSLALLPGRSSLPGLGARGYRRAVVLAVGAGALVFLAGWVGAALALLAVLVTVLNPRRAHLAQAAGSLVVASALLVAWRPFPGSDALDLAAGPQILVVAAAALLVAGVALGSLITAPPQLQPAAEPEVEAARTDAPPPAS